jgi:hypothetical protein
MPRPLAAAVEAAAAGPGAYPQSGPRLSLRACTQHHLHRRPSLEQPLPGSLQAGARLSCLRSAIVLQGLTLQNVVPTLYQLLSGAVALLSPSRLPPRSQAKQMGCPAGAPAAIEPGCADPSFDRLCLVRAATDASTPRTMLATTAATWELAPHALLPPRPLGTGRSMREMQASSTARQCAATCDRGSGGCLTLL